MRRMIKFLLVAALLFTSLTVGGCKKPKESAAITIDVNYDEKQGIISGKAAYKFVNTTKRVLSSVLFNLPANAYNGKNSPCTKRRKTDAYYDGESLGGIKITSCTLAGSPASFVISDDELTLSVSTGEIKPESETNIEIEFETTLPKAALRLGITENTVNLAEFYPVLCKLTDIGFSPAGYYPIGDPYYSDVADYSLSIGVPSRFTVACSGSPEKTVIDGERTKYSYTLKNGRDFAMVLSDKFCVSVVKSGKTDIFYYSAEKDENTEKILAEIKSCFEYFGSSFGEYPYKTFSVVETEFILGGMEYSGLCYVAENQTPEEKLYAALHETAHQWWGITVGNDQINEAFLDEGLAEFSVYLYLDSSGKNTEAESMENERKAAYKSFFDIKSTLSGNKNTSMKRGLSTFETEDEYVAIAYDKSFIMFRELLGTAGKKRMLSSMKKFYANNKFLSGGTEELIKAFGYKEYFTSFINGKVIV